MPVATRRSKPLPVAQEQKEATITKPLSFQMTKNLLRISLFQIAFIRNIFPENYFSERSIFDDQLNVKVLNPKCGLSRRLVDWMEKGVTEALYKEYLKCLRFGITSDDKGENLIEEYVFTFAYQSDGEIRLQILNSIKKSPVNALKSTGSIEQLKGQVSKMTRLLIALMASFDPLPSKKYISLHLEYHDRAPKNYEPPFFEAAPALPQFRQKPFSMGLGACQTRHICIGMKAKTTAVSDMDQEYSVSVNNNNNSAAEEARSKIQIEPSQMDDLSSLDTVFDIKKFASSQPDEAMENVSQIIAEHDQASEWAKSKMKHSNSYDDTATDFQSLSLVTNHARNQTKRQKDFEAKVEAADDPLVWDNIPASQPEPSNMKKKKKVSRGILTSHAGPSKRIRMQELD